MQCNDYLGTFFEKKRQTSLSEKFLSAFFKQILLGKPDEVFVIRIHVSELAINEQNKLFLAYLLSLSDMTRYDCFGLLPKSRVPRHLNKQTFYLLCKSYKVFVIRIHV